MWCNSSPSAAFSGDRGIRLAPRLAPAGDFLPRNPLAPLGGSPIVAPFASLGLDRRFFQKSFAKIPYAITPDLSRLARGITDGLIAYLAATL